MYRMYRIKRETTGMSLNKISLVRDGRKSGKGDRFMCTMILSHVHSTFVSIVAWYACENLNYL